MTPYDLIIIGGGINGAGIARDAAGQGLSVLLAEQDDLASATSSASTKLIHGGLRYLEQYDFALVRKSLQERERLMRMAPHIIWPMGFLLPHEPHLRSKWMIRLGLYLYDHLARSSLPQSRSVDLQSMGEPSPLKDMFGSGFLYHDCWVQDARLVVLNAMDAAARGAAIRVRTRCESAKVVDGLWHVSLVSAQGKEVMQGRVLVNAAGPWAAQFAQSVEVEGKPKLRLSKGSHIVVPRLFSHHYSYLLQREDGRILFVIPYEKDFTLIGTTDVAYEGDPAGAAITEDEVAYLCDGVNHYFASSVSARDVVWSYAGVRPLIEDGEASLQEVSRDYQLRLDDSAGAPLLHVLGGKLTTYRALAEEVMAKLAPVMGWEVRSWTADEVLPGAFEAEMPLSRFAGELRRKYCFMDEPMARHYASHYGTLSYEILEDAKGLEDLGRYYGDTLYEVELEWLKRSEWAQTSEDVLWRRTKYGLRLRDEQVSAVQAFF